MDFKPLQLPDAPVPGSSASRYTGPQNYSGGKLSRWFLWIWFGIVLVVALPCTVVSILSLLDFFTVKSDLKGIKETLQGHKSRPYFELQGIKTQNESEGVCDIVTSGNQSLLRFDENQSTTNEYDSYRTRITGSEDTNDTMFSVPLSGIYEMQFRAVSGYEENNCTSALSVNGKEKARFPCDFRNGAGRGNIVTWQTLVYLNKMDKVSVKVEEKDVFRCTDKQRLSLIGEMKAKKGAKKGEEL